MSLFQKIFQQFLRRFFTDMGREPMPPAEWMEIQDQAVRHLNKTKGAPSIKKDPFQGFDPKIVGKEPIVEEKIGIEELLKGPVRSKGPKGDRIWDFSEKRGEIIDFPSNPNRTLEQQARSLGLMNPKLNKFMQKGDIQVGKAPKTQKSTLDAKKDVLEEKISKEEWIAKRKQDNKDAIARFKEKNPDKFYAGGIAPLVGEPSYAANFYDDRTPMAGGALVKGGRWFLNNLRRALKDIEADQGFKNLTPERKEGLTSEIKNLIKSIEGGGPIPDEMIQTIRKDPKFAEISKTRSTDPDLYEFEDVVLNYNKDVDRMKDISQKIDLDEFDVTGQTKHADGGRVSYSGGGLAGLPAVTMGQSQPEMQGPQMPASAPQPTGIPGANLQMNQMNLMQQQMQQDPWMHNQMKQGIGGMQSPKYGGQLRMPFGAGGMGRRAFLKLMGMAAALPFMPKAASKLLPTAAPKIAETVATAGSATGMPSWFPAFVQKVLKEGKDLTPTHAPKERVIVAETKLPKSDTPVYVEHDIVTGDTMVHIGQGKHGWSDGYHGQPTRLHLKKGEMIEEGKMKGQKEPDEFVVEEAEFTGGHPENVKFEESSFNNYGEHGSDFSELEEFATGKVTKESKAAKQVWEADWDDSLPDDYASGGIARMLGE